MIEDILNTALHGDALISDSQALALADCDDTRALADVAEQKPEEHKPHRQQGIAVIH